MAHRHDRSPTRHVEQRPRGRARRHATRPALAAALEAAGEYAARLCGDSRGEGPRYLLGIGPGAVRALRRAHEVLATPGSVQAGSPPILVVAERARPALARAAADLAGVPHVALQADGSKPEEVVDKLRGLGLNPLEGLPLLALVDGPTARVKGVPALESWAHVLGEHGMIVLPALPGSAHRTRAADGGAFLLAAARARLFPCVPASRHVADGDDEPAVFVHLERRDYIVRLAALRDLAVLAELEKSCWATALRAAASTLRRRIERFPAGQLVLEREGEVVAAVYSQRIAALEALEGITSTRAAALHRESGAILQLLAVNVFPRMQELGLGDQLLEFALLRAACMRGIQTVAGVTRCARYRHHDSLSVEEYVRLRDAHGRLVDPILALHERHGAAVVGPIANYRPADAENRGYGVLVTYDPHDRHPDAPVARESGSALSYESVLGVVEQAIRGLLGADQQDAYSARRPLMEMGLTSADLSALDERLRAALAARLEPAFFFRHNTAERIAVRLSDAASPPAAGPAAAEGLPADALRRGADAEGSATATPPPADRANGRGEAPGHLGRSQPPASRDVAIIGMACRLPGGIERPHDLWNLLLRREDAISQLPEGRWTWPADVDPRERHAGIDRGGFLSDLAAFDARFFRISPAEAEWLDPQQRILLELSWEALEDAGYAARSLAGARVGVFVGASGSDYSLLLNRDVDSPPPYAGTGTALAMLANRISYFFDLEGPSLQIDTACSSSLVAVHQAVKVLQAGECCLALAGGINVMCHPAPTIAYYKMGMLAADGRCKTFDAAADGYVRAEGAALVLLKPLEQALADGDAVYAVIKGSAVNHGAQSGGLTAPNPGQQAALLVDAYRDAGVSPETVGYVEAHGTGTSLGDPIEVRALTDAFATLAAGHHRSRAPWCGLGSVKTNLGHLEAASGVAGLMKVVLSLAHGRLPASLHFRQPNPRIDFAHSPFFVVREEQAFEPPVPGVALRAGVNNFGWGGANAHVVLEQQTATARPRPQRAGPRVCVLSARTEEQLREQARRLARQLDAATGTLDAQAMAELAHTLQLGREPMEERLAAIALDPRELSAELEAFARDGNAASGVHHARAPEREGLLRALTRDRSAEAAAEAALQQRDLAQLARLWVAGAEVHWERLHDGERLRPARLPTYPFTRERYWVPADATAPARKASAVPIPALHPLLDRNESTLAEQRFVKRLRRGEFFIFDHVVHGKNLLPGVAHLEMARAAAAASLERPVGVLKDVMWGRPVLVEGDELEIAISLRREGSHLAFQIFAPEAVAGERTVYSHGWVDVASETTEAEPEHFDLDALRRACPGRKSKAEVYAFLRRIGFAYGPTFQCTAELAVGDTQALIELRPDEQHLAAAGGFVLHPALMDAAFRTSSLIGLDINGLNDVLRVPFSLEELRVFSAPEPRCYAYARVVRQTLDGDYVTDVSIVAADGRELVRFKNYSGKVFRVESEAAPARSPGKALFFAPNWVERPVGRRRPLSAGATLLVFDRDLRFTQALRARLERDGALDPARVVAIEHDRRLEQVGADHWRVSLDEPEQVRRLMERLPAAGGGPRYVVAVHSYAPAAGVFPGPEGVVERLERRFDAGLYRLLHVVQALLASGPLARLLYAFHAGADGAAPDNECVAGLARVVPGLVAVQCALEDLCHPEVVAGLADELCCDEQHPDEVRLDGRRRFVREFERRVAPVQAAAFSPTRGGNYLITGGAGALGRVFAAHLARKYGVRPILLGRSPRGPRIEPCLADLRALGVEAAYVEADAGDHERMAAALTAITPRLGPIHGVIHAAGGYDRRLLIDSDKAGFAANVRAKINGALALDQLTRDEPLDCFILFSSVAARLGDFGRGYYAVANRFLDSFAALRAHWVEEGRRRGLTLSFNWPLWREGGFDRAFFLGAGGEELYYRQGGFAALATEDGLDAFETAARLGEPQVLVATGERARIERALGVRPAVGVPLAGAARAMPRQAGAERRVDAELSSAAAGVEPGASEPRAAVGSGEPADELVQPTTEYLKHLIAAVTKVPVTDIRAREPLGHYGFGSVIVMELTRRLRERFGSVPGTLFFEYVTVEAVAGYFVQQHAERLRELLGAQPPAATSAPAAPSSPAGGVGAPLVVTGASRTERPGRAADVAIVGMAGRYPKAPTLAAFWELLAGGRDAIEEIPRERWDHSQYYSAEGKRAGWTNSKWGGFLEDFDKFDASFFNISPREAGTTDPQVRLFMEVAWEACEDAGFVWDRLSNRDLPRANDVGVFVGSMYDDYQFFDQEADTSYWNAFLANRVSYWFNFRGPSLMVDTACSSSLTTVYLACESLRRGECRAALAGGVNLSVHPSKYVRLSRYNLLAHDGRCRAFGTGGSGYVPGEGVGAVLLKRLPDALRDGDHVRAVIKGGALNHGGRTNGLTVPNPNAQAELIARALENSGVPARTISYVEAHGTGTQLGDPIELAGLSQAFARHTPDKRFCAIGSVKSNLGHLEGAAGIVGLTKVVLQMQRRQLVPSLHCDPLNPLIDFDDSPFVVQRALAEWSRPVLDESGSEREFPRRAGVSSFGAGGSNAHLILEEYVESVDGAPSAPVLDAPVVVPLSARNEERLRAVAERLASFLGGGEGVPALPDVAYTLQVGREAMEQRVAFVARSADELRADLDAFARGGAGDWAEGRAPKDPPVGGRVRPDPDLSRAIGAWVREGLLRDVAAAWAEGGSVDWSLLHASGVTPRRVSLPSYPFARERHWVAAGRPEALRRPAPAACDPADEAVAGTAVVGKDPPGAVVEAAVAPVLAYREVWVAQDAVPGDLPVPAEPVDVVVFARDDGDAAAWRDLAPSLGARARVIVVRMGAALRRRSEVEYEAPCEGGASAWAQLVRGLQAERRAERVAVLRWAEGRGLSGVHTLFDAVRAAHDSDAGLSRLLVTGRGLDDVEGCYDLSWIGFERSLGLVMPESSLRLVYAEPGVLDAATLWRELGAGGVIRYRGGRRQRLDVEPLGDASAGALPLRPHGTYFLTGGAGGLGLLFAQHLARRGAAALVLAGRRPLDAALQARLDELRGAGAGRAEYVQADVTDEAALLDAVQAARRRHGAIHGVLHAAGLEPRGSIHALTWAAFEAGLGPKVAGTLALEASLAALTPDFVCYFSSVAALLGDFGACHYAVGNRFQMAYAEHAQGLSAGARRLALAWPLWREGGMRVGDREQTDMYLRSSGQVELETGGGLRAWEDALRRGHAHEIVFAGDRGRIDGFLRRAYAGHARPVGTRAAPARSPAPAPPAVDLSLQARVEQELRDAVATVLHMRAEQLDEDAPFVEFGFDSITLGELGENLSRRFGFGVAPAVFYGFGTIRKLGRHLVDEQGASLVALYGTAATGDAPPAPDETPAAAAPDGPRRRRRVPAEREPVAVIGMAGRFPGAADVDELRDLLAGGRSAVREVPSERWDWRPYYHGHGDARNRMATPRGAFIEGVEDFDPLFFGISPREAEGMDPRQRLFLQEAWHAFEDAGYVSSGVSGTPCGVFIGVEEGDHAWRTLARGMSTGNHAAVLAARISYRLDLRGPNLAINTACSSALVAVHQACQALQRGECELALVGGVSLLLSPAAHLMLSEMKMLSPDGECRPFDARANGIVPGEAVSAVLLKPLSDALRDGDPVRGVLRASAVNHDGRTHGLWAPSLAAQTQLLRTLYETSGLGADTVEYVLAHSVGSPVGDPIEIQALAEAARVHTTRRQFCALGSIKPALGHTFAASGLVNLIVMCLALRDRALPPTLNWTQAPPQVDLEATPFFIDRAPRAWPAPAGGGPRRGLVSATGMSGTNAAVLVEEPPPRPAPSAAAAPPGGRELLVLSARGEEELRASAERLAAYLETHAELALGDVAYTLQTGREAFRQRLLVAADDLADARGKLRAYARDSRSPGVYRAEVKAKSARDEAALADEIEAARGAWRRHGDPSRVAELWARGVALGWDRVGGSARPRRVPLPGYPFARHRYPLPPESGRPTEAAAARAEAGGGGRPRKRVCVIGAGPAGLVMAKSLLEEGHEPVVYEQQASAGGLWVLRRDKTAGAYKKVRFQTSRYTSTFSDFLVDELNSTFYDVTDVKAYLDAYTRHFGLNAHLRLETQVTSVAAAGGRWRVETRRDGALATEEFDGVAMCHGMFWKPRRPEIPGLERFRGELLHSGQYYDASLFKGRRVLVIGDGVSGMDVAEEAAATGAEVSWSVRSRKLILPRMVGFVPNDCQSVASLLLPRNRTNQLDRIRRSLPDYYALYAQSGLLPTAEDAARNPTVHINDAIVGLVAAGRVQVRGEVTHYGPGGFHFDDSAGAPEDFDVVVFCTGYVSDAFDFLEGVSVRDEFAMGLFHHANPTLVNTSGLLFVAFSGFFFFAEMVSRWYAGLLSGRYTLTEEERRRRIGPRHRAVIGPLAGLMFGLRLGLLPRPEEDFDTFWRLVSLPPFPMIYRLRGPHADPQAPQRLEQFRRTAFVRTEAHDPELRELRLRLLAGLRPDALASLRARGSITAADLAAAQARRSDPLRLEWDLQYVIDPQAREGEPPGAERSRYADLVEAIRDGRVGREELLARLA